MTSYFDGLVDFVGAHPQLSFLTVFLLALSEAVPVIGTVVPGSTLILAISALATTAGITPWGLLVAAVAGAIVGDGFSFWLGHRYRRQILRGWPLNRFPGLIARSALLIRKYGIASVFLARFAAVVRAFVPLLAGILRMSSRHFYVANILSALVWAPMHVFPGVLVGLAIAFGGAHAPELSLAAMGVLILAWIAWSMIKRKTAGIADCLASQDAPGSGRRKAAARPTEPKVAPLVRAPRPAARLDADMLRTGANRKGRPGAWPDGLSGELPVFLPVPFTFVESWPKAPDVSPRPALAAYRALPTLGVVPVVNVLANLILGKPVALLNLSLKLISPTVDRGQVVVR